MPSALRFRLYPSRQQEARMLRALEACRHLWNDALSHRRDRWQNERRSTSYNHQQWVLTAMRHADPELGALYSQVAQDVLRRLDRAFTAFFEQRSRYPRFKKFSQSWSFTYPQCYNGSVKPDVLRGRLFLSKVGNVKAVFHRPLPRDARPKTCTVIRDRCGEWYASLVCEEIVPLQDVSPPRLTTTVLHPSNDSLPPVGVDLGLKSLVTTSDGEKVEHPKYLRKAERRLKRLQSAFSRKKRRSRNQGKARNLLAVQHARVRRRRADFNHKLSSGLVKGHGLVAFEDLRVRNMVRNHALAKSIQDAGWGQLVRFAEYKAVKVGKLVVRVEPACSTQECFLCGFLNSVDVSVGEFVCRGCGRALDRDVNAAKVVLKRAVAQVGQDMPELKPVETGPIPVQATGCASPVVEAGTTRAETGAGSPQPSGVGGCHVHGVLQAKTQGQHRLQFPNFNYFFADCLMLKSLVEFVPYGYELAHATCNSILHTFNATWLYLHIGAGGNRHEQADAGPRRRAASSGYSIPVRDSDQGRPGVCGKTREEFRVREERSVGEEIPETESY